MKSHARKRRTREHIIADLSVNHVERQALLCGYTVQRMTHDYGIDVLISTFNDEGEVEEGKILLQLKATDALNIRGEAVKWRIDRADLVSWLRQPMPVILVVYDADSEVAYWLYIQSYFRKLEDFNLFTAGKTITVNVQKANIVSPSAVRKFRRFRERALEQMGEVIHAEDED